MPVQFRKRLRLIKLGPFQLVANVSMQGTRMPRVSFSFKAGPATVNTRGGRSVDLPGPWSWRGGSR